MSDELKIQKAIKSYLLKNPDYFDKYPELVGEIKVATKNGDVTDFATHQLRTLQKENKQLKQQISTLIQNAQQSESMMNRMFDLLIKLSVVDSTDFLTHFVTFVKENFKADYFKIMLDESLVDLGSDVHLGIWTPSHQKHFEEFNTQSEPLSGRIQKQKVNSIFPEGVGIESAVILPIGEKASLGLMAFASTDEEKFHPHMASDLLQKLTEILATYLNLHHPKNKA